MRYLMPVALIGLLMAVAAEAADQAPHAAVSAHASEHGASWDYTEQHGPARWAEIDPAYVLAAVGGSQSPIDIQPSDAIGADLPPLSIESHPQALHMLNNGHTVEAVCPGAATLRFGDHEYELRQFHFHAPSEHTIEGEHAEVELHFVHADGEGHLAVIAVLFGQGEAEHPQIAQMLAADSVAHAGDEIVEESTYIDIRELLPESLEYYTYEGSLTTPPATEGVRWFVLKRSLHLSREQIAAIDRVYYSNNRPTQPLNARFVLTRR